MPDPANHPAAALLIPADQASPLLLDADGVCLRLSIGKSHFFELKKTDRFPLQPLRLGRCVRFRADELQRWIDAGCPGAMRWKALKQMEATSGRRATR